MRQTQRETDSRADSVRSHRLIHNSFAFYPHFLYAAHTVRLQKADHGEGRADFFHRLSQFEEKTRLHSR